MAGQHRQATNTGRSYTPDASKGWHELGFNEYSIRATQGQKDLRTPVISNQIPRVPITTYAGTQLRQPLSLLSQKFNVSFSQHTGQVYQPEAVMLATNKTGTGLGIGKLKNLDVNAKSSFSNLLSRATATGRMANRIPAS